MKRKLLCTALAATLYVCGLHCISPAQTVQTSADGVYTQAFASADAIDEFEIVKDDTASTVRVENGALQITNVSGTTELVLPVERNDFVIEFDYTRLQENDIIDSTYGIIDTSIGINYRQANDFGYETKIHSTQRDGKLNNGFWGEWAGQHYASATTTNEGGKLSNELAGHGLANWLHEDEDSSKLLTYYYYANRLHLSETYRLRLQVSGDMVMLYINEEQYLKDILDDVTDGTGLSFKIQGDCTVAIDNLSVYSPTEYAEKLISALPEIKDGQDEATVKNYQAALENVRDFGLYFLDNKYNDVSNYVAFEEKENQLESLYEIKLSQKPVLVVAWSEAEYISESVITLPQATAKDVKGNELVVDVKVKFNDKFVKCENNAFTANEAGEYTVVYTAHDASGNESVTEYTLQVTQKAPDTKTVELTKKPNYALLIVSCSVFAVVVIGYVVGLIWIRRKKK